MTKPNGFQITQRKESGDNTRRGQARTGPSMSKSARRQGLDLGAHSARGSWLGQMAHIHVT
jgi:hypothetical protein